MAAEIWGKTNGGMQMSLSASTANDITVSLRNCSKQDKMIRLGIMLGPVANRKEKGKYIEEPVTQYQFPTDINLLIKDAGGKATLFQIKGPPGVAGTMEPMEVPLPPGAVYTLHALLTECIDPKNFDQVPKGVVQITAKYVGKSSHSRVNRNYWTGSLESNTISIKL